MLKERKNRGERERERDIGGEYDRWVDGVKRERERQ